MVYKLINKLTGETRLCDKVIIDGFDYYVSGEKPTIDTYFISRCKKILAKANSLDYSLIDSDGDGQATIRYNNGLQYLLALANKPIATNNPNIDIPKVVNEVEELAWHIINNKSSLTKDEEKVIGFTAFYEGYAKSQETHSNTDEDMIEFAKWCDNSEEAARFWRINRVIPTMDNSHLAKMQEKRKELLQLWKEQKPKIVYYE